MNADEDRFVKEVVRRFAEEHSKTEADFEHLREQIVATIPHESNITGEQLDLLIHGPKDDTKDPGARDKLAATYPLLNKIALSLYLGVDDDEEEDEEEDDEDQDALDDDEDDEQK